MSKEIRATVTQNDILLSLQAPTCSALCGAGDSLSGESAQASEAEGKDRVVSKMGHYPGPSLPKVCILGRNTYNSYQ